MTICIVSLLPLCEIGGVSTFNKNFIALFANANNKVIFLTVDDTKKVEDDIVLYESSYLTNVILNRTYKKYKNYYKNFFSTGSSDAPKWIAIGYAVKQWLLQNSSSYKIDVIEVSDGIGIGTFLTDKSLPPVLLTAHGSSLQITQYDYNGHSEQTAIIQKLEQLSYKGANAIISHSPLNTTELRNFTNRRIFQTLIPWVINNNEAAYQHSDTFGLVVGKLRYLKGPITLCKALEQLQNKSQTIKVKWIGGDSVSLKNYSGTVSCYIKEKFPSIYGSSFEWVPGISTYETINEIKKAAYIIIPSVWETFNYVALEAASLGKAIIITRKTGASFLFTHDENALVIEENNEQELTSAIALLHMNKNLRERLGAAAKKLIQQTFKPESIVEQRIKIYEKVIADKKNSKEMLQESLTFLNPYLSYKRFLFFKGYNFLKKIYNKSQHLFSRFK